MRISPVGGGWFKGNGPRRPYLFVG
jgi:hypothetical protein